MKQIFQNPKTGKTKIEEITSPKLKACGVLVRNRFSLISPGTERGIIELSKKGILQKAKERPDYVAKFFMLAKTKGIMAAWQVAKSKLESDIALGYSTSGKVIEVGKDVEEFKNDDRVACAGQNYASHAEIIFVPKNLCVKIPQSVSDEEAAFVTLGAIAMQGIRRAELSSGEKIAVVGLGLLGQLSIKMLKAYGHPAIAFDIDAEKVSRAKENGVDVGIVLNKENYQNAVEKFSGGKGVDAVLIYASAKSNAPLKLAVEISREKGRVVQIGNILTNIPWRDFYKKELDYRASCSYGPGRYDHNYEEGGKDYPFSYVRWTEKRNMEEFLRLLADKKISVKDLTSGIFPIEQAEKAYEMVFKPKGSVYGILLSYPQKESLSDTLIIDSSKESIAAATKKSVNIGIIGLGSFATSTIIPHLKDIKDKDFRIYAVCDSTGKKAKEIGEKWGSEYITNDYRKIIDDKNIDLIICSTRHSSHAKIASEALLLDKNIYMEKPVALNEEGLKEVIKSAEKSKGRLFTGFNRRFSTHFLKAKEEFSGVSPMMIMYRVNYPFFEKDHWSYDLKEGGRLIGEDCHFVDALQYLIGSKPRRIFTSVIPVGGAVSHEENVAINIEYQNNSLGVIFYSALGSFRLPKEYIEIYGGWKAMTIDNFKNAKIIYPNKAKNLSLWHQDKGYTRELEIFIDAIKTGKPSPFSLEEIYDVHLTTFKIVESMKSGKVVEL
ncbi:MAG: bi-domain-containing oxidoreductase [Patescibacteria group bacterium]